MRTSDNRIAAVQGYTVYQIGLHGLIAALVFAQVIFGESMSEAIEAAEEGRTGCCCACSGHDKPTRLC
jgi:hypothetical protein